MIFLNSKDINEYEEELYATLTLHKEIFRLLRIFANTYYNSNKGREENRVDEFLSKEVTKITTTLAEDTTGPAQEGFPESLKQSIQRSLNQYKNYENEKQKEDLR
jgi:hypothetical protein